LDYQKRSHTLCPKWVDWRVWISRHIEWEASCSASLR
jgi:hypothetical protein